MSASNSSVDSSDVAFQRFVVPEIEVMYRVARRLTGDGHEAEDLVQDALVRAYRAVDRFDGRHPRAWLLTILRNTHLNRRRRRQPEPAYDADAIFGTLPARGADGRDGAAEIVLEQIPDRRLVTGLRQLSPAHRSVVMLVDVDGLRYREAAEVLGVPLGTVMSRLHRARRSLRDHLEATGYLDEVRR